MKSDSNFNHKQPACTGILLSNLGTPDEPSTSAVRRYLREFLSDDRVIEIPKIIWWPILHGIILNTRPRKSAQKYAEIWSDQGSPLLAISKHQGSALEQQLQQHYSSNIKVAVAMRYGNPSIAAGLQELQQAGARRILILPLYPQYSAATTASTFDAVADVLREWRWLPELRMVNHYHDHPAYIKAVADSIRTARQQQTGHKLLFSFHGLPKRNLLLGDPYHCECHKTARLVAEQLQLNDDDWQVSFQSRFGRAEWLKPYTSETLEQWAKAGIDQVDVICPGFAADCLETLEEIEQENRELFMAAGGKQYRYIPALNDSSDHIDALVDLVIKHTQGWPEFDRNIDEINQDQLQQSQQRAIALGASA